MQANAIRKTIKKVVILGGGSAGWMTAAALSKFIATPECSLTLIESDEIGIVGVGEATLPHLRVFNQRLGIDEREFMNATQATFKLGIQFVNWGKLGDAYIHPFGEYGEPMHHQSFHHTWLRLLQNGLADPLDEYSFAVKTAEAEKFSFPSTDPTLVSSTYGYAYHVDATLYGQFLKKYALERNVKRVEGKAVCVHQHPETEFISSIELESGELIEGDLFIDCSGFRGMLIEQTLKTGYQDWRHYLPCDSAVAVTCEKVGETLPYSIATARDAGWQWRIPLQSRTGNGYVYSSQYLSDEDAKKTLLTHLDGKPLREPLQLRFTTGKRNKIWNKNCIAVGLSSGFLEPLESTSIYLIQETINKILDFFPDNVFDSAVTDEFNRVMDNEYLRIRDFLVLHYHATQRNDTPFWNYCRTMPIPDSLSHQMNLFKTQGLMANYEAGLFFEASWLAVYIGQGVLPKNVHPAITNAPLPQLQSIAVQLRESIRDGVNQLPSHHDFLDRYLHQPKEQSGINNLSVPVMSLYGARRT
jgi:tryptophan 7-halogenase